MRQTIPQTSAERDRVRLIERPDGFYWQSREDGREYGPFATLLEAMQDLQASGDDEAPEDDEKDLAEAEADLGIADGAEPEEGVDLEEQ